MMTPWGRADHVRDIGLGILRVDTPRHGGYYVPPMVRTKMPTAALRTFAGLGWYEEDADWCMVCLSFPDLFPPEALDMAKRTAQVWSTPEVCKAFGLEWKGRRT
jgi:hypothetical protein